MSPFIALLKRDLLLAFRRRSQLINPLLFYILVVMLFPLGVGPDPLVLKTIGPGIIWVTALLAVLLSLDTLFRNDLEDGSLEFMLMSPYPLVLLVLAKLLVHWLIVGIPLILLSPLLGVLFSLSVSEIFVLVITLLLGTPILSMIGGIGAGLSAGLKNGSALLSLVILPLYIPVLIFSASAVNDVGAGLPIAAQLYYLAAMLVLSITLAPFATAAALRITAN